jgi:hypothetical protein
MECTQDLHHQEQLDQQEQEEPTIENFNLLAYKCMGVAQAIRDLKNSGIDRPETLEARLVELAEQYDRLFERKSK